MATTMTVPPGRDESAALAQYESRYALDSIGFIRWMLSEDATDEMVAARQVLTREESRRV